jgi:hypothetical protein
MAIQRTRKMDKMMIFVVWPAWEGEAEQGWVDRPGWYCSREQCEVCTNPDEPHTLACGGRPSPAHAVVNLTKEKINIKEK